MGYPSFGKVKTIVLPCPSYSDTLSISQYKEKFGIDLSEYLILDNGYIYFDAKGNLILINSFDIDSVGEHISYGLNHAIVPLVATKQLSWLSGSDTGVLKLGIYEVTDDDCYGLYIFVDKDDDFTMDNVRIRGSNV